jgi:hypothetical protein
MVCHAGRYTTVNKSDDSKLQYGLVNVQPVAAVAVVAVADVADAVEAVVVADVFDPYKSATRSASVAGGMGEDDTFLESDADLATDADAVLPLTGG